jgi:hypothetical protein
MSAPLIVRPDEVDALAAQLAALAARLEDDAAGCAGAGAAAATALPGGVGWSTGAAVHAWGALGHTLAGRLSAAATTLTAAMAAYRAAEADRAARLAAAGSRHQVAE